MPAHKITREEINNVVGNSAFYIITLSHGDAYRAKVLQGAQRDKVEGLFNAYGKDNVHSTKQSKL